MLAHTILHHIKRSMIATLPVQFKPQPRGLDDDNNLLKDRSQ